MTRIAYQSTTAMGVYLKYGVAPAGGAVFSLQIKAGEAAHVTFPATVTLLEGECDRQFQVAWASEGSTVLQAQLTEWGGSPRTGDIYERDVIALPETTITMIGVEAVAVFEDEIQASGEV